MKFILQYGLFSDNDTDGIDRYEVGSHNMMTQQRFFSFIALLFAWVMTISSTNAYTGIVVVQQRTYPPYRFSKSKSIPCYEQKLKSSSSSSSHNKKRNTTPTATSSKTSSSESLISGVQEQQWNTTTTTSSHDSLGSLFVQLQKDEVSLLAQAAAEVSSNHPNDDISNLHPLKKYSNSNNQTQNINDDHIDIDSSINSMEQQIITTIPEEPNVNVVLPSSSSSSLPTMDMETAKELDDTIIKLLNTKDYLLQDITILPLNPLYDTSHSTATTTTKTIPQNISTTTTTTTTIPMVVGRPEQYIDRIHRDRKHLAVSIASSIVTTEQYRQFCLEQGGIYPILETIHDGAQMIRYKKYYSTDVLTMKQQQQLQSQQQHCIPNTDTSYIMLKGSMRDQYEEETFHAACSACRAIRDLCAISPEQASVITDSILRTNAAWNNQLMIDFQLLLQYVSDYGTVAAESARDLSKRLRIRNRRDVRLRCQLYVTQLLLVMAVASDDAVHAIRVTTGLSETIVGCSSYALTEQTRRWLRYPGEMIKWLYRKSKSNKKYNNTNRNNKVNHHHHKGMVQKQYRRPFLEAGNLGNDLKGQVQRSSNQILAAIGYNRWIPKMPGQKGLRILSLDGGGSRGMAAITAIKCMMDAAGNGSDVADSFDMIVGTSTGGIIAFLIGLQRESSGKAVERYQQLIDKIFVKSALSAPLMLFTTATYDESNFMSILVNILKEDTMLDSRADPAVPLVCCLASKMSSTPTHVALFRNYNYVGGEFADPFTIDPYIARQELGIPIELEHEVIQNGHYHRITTSVSSPGVKTDDGSRHPGSFRVLQRYALRASTAAPTVFKPVMMGGEMYCDGGIVASNPTAVAIHEARAIFPDIPIELVVSVGTGAFLEQKSAPRVGWDGIIGQIINSATDGEQIHHILEDVLGTSSVVGDKTSASRKARYFRFNPIVGTPNDFPIDVTDPVKLAELRDITTRYMSEPAQIQKLERINDILSGRKGFRRRIEKLLHRKKGQI